MFHRPFLRYPPQLMQHSKLDLDRFPGSNGNSLVIGLKGKLSLETVASFLQTLRSEHATYLILDLREVSFLDSAGVGALVQLFVHRRNAGMRFALAGLTKQGNAIMQVAGLTKLLPIYASVDEALAQAK